MKRIQELRRYLKTTQQELADEIGVRQQTVSDWETGVYAPRGASNTMLTFIAERSRFKYKVQQKKDE